MTEQRVSKLGCVLLWGRMGQGKTLLALRSPYKPILHIDMHGSARHYFADQKRLGLDFAWQLCLTPEEVKPALDLARSKHWGTIVLDTVAEFTDPLVSHFQTVHAGKMDKQSQLVWGIIKDAIHERLTALMAQCDLLVLVADARTYNNVTEPKAISAAVRLTDLVMQLQREPNKAVPAGIVTRTRLHGLPPRLPEATWEAIFGYLKHPADWSALKPEEMAPEELFVALTDMAA